MLTTKAVQLQIISGDVWFDFYFDIWHQSKLFRIYGNQLGCLQIRLWKSKVLPAASVLLMARPGTIKKISPTLHRGALCSWLIWHARCFKAGLTHIAPYLICIDSVSQTSMASKMCFYNLPTVREVTHPSCLSIRLAFHLVPVLCWTLHCRLFVMNRLVVSWCVVHEPLR